MHVTFRSNIKYIYKKKSRSKHIIQTFLSETIIEKFNVVSQSQSFNFLFFDSFNQKRQKGNDDDVGWWGKVRLMLMQGFDSDHVYISCVQCPCMYVI